MSQTESCVRTRGELVGWLERGNKAEYLFFWGHTPKSQEDIDKSCFSQWFPSSFRVADHLYPTAEHFMMAEKARLFGDGEIEKKILNSIDPHQAKKLVRLVKNYEDKIWLKHRFEIVLRGNFAKFYQNPSLQKFLLGTNSRVLVEASPEDRIWGIGLGPDNPAIKNPSHWRGENLLGFALMEVRRQLLQH